MKKMIERVRQVPRYGIIGGFQFLGFQALTYVIGNLISRLTGTVSWAIAPKIPCIDDLIPLFPPAAYIYMISFVFWVCGTWMVSRTDRKHFMNFTISFIAAVLVGFLFFVFMPTYIDRVAEGAIAAAERPGITNFVLKTAYIFDGWERGWNLFPSFHCMDSMFIYLGRRKRPEIKRSTRITALVFTLLICASTVLTKQHYFIDVAGGLGLAIICHAVVQKLDPAEKLIRNNRHL